MDIKTLQTDLCHEHTLAAVTAERLYVLPHKALQGVISHYTLFCSQNHHKQETDNASISIIPDASGCLVFSFDASRHARAVFWGPTSHVVTVHNGSRIAPLMIFVEFLPGGAASLLPMSMDQWRDSILPLDDAYPHLHTRLREAFALYGSDRPQWSRLLHEMNRIFLQQLHERPHERLVRHVLSSINASQGRLRVHDLSQETGYSVRHLNRVASEITGLNLKRLNRIIRVNAVCRTFAAQSDMPLTQLAHMFDYYDQAHFIHDFTAICGVTPGCYAKAVSEFYNEDLKLGGISPCK